MVGFGWVGWWDVFVWLTGWVRSLWVGWVEWLGLFGGWGWVDWLGEVALGWAGR